MGFLPTNLEVPPTSVEVTLVHLFWQSITDDGNKTTTTTKLARQSTRIAASHTCAVTTVCVCPVCEKNVEILYVPRQSLREAFEMLVSVWSASIWGKIGLALSMLSTPAVLLGIWLMHYMPDHKVAILGGLVLPLGLSLRHLWSIVAMLRYQLFYYEAHDENRKPGDLTGRHTIDSADKASMRLMLGGHWGRAFARKYEVKFGSLQKQ